MPRTLLITGPTATGKTHIAVALASRFHGEILSADSRQVYRGMNIGTGKDLEEYTVNGMTVPVHLLDVVLPTEDFHLFAYLANARQVLEDIAARNRLPVVAGGTPLYIKALLDGYDYEGGSPDETLRGELERKSTAELLEILRQKAPPPLLARTDCTQRRRIIRAIELAIHGRFLPQVSNIQSPLLLAPYYPRTAVRQRILERLEARLQNGMVEEVQALHDGRDFPPVSWERMEWLGLEYRFLARYLQGMLSYDEMKQQLCQHICRFAKNQDVWFRKLERDGHVIHWLPEGDLDLAEKLVGLWLEGRELPPPVLRLNDIRYT